MSSMKTNILTTPINNEMHGCFQWDTAIFKKEKMDSGSPLFIGSLLLNFEIQLIERVSVLFTKPQRTGKEVGSRNEIFPSSMEIRNNLPITYGFCISFRVEKIVSKKLSPSHILFYLHDNETSKEQRCRQKVGHKKKNNCLWM